MSDKYFVDTNTLMYAHDRSVGAKHERAKALVEKLTVDDRFDDLSTIDVDGHRERTQFKHPENADRPLSLVTFTTEARSLRLDLVVASILADRSGPGRPATESPVRQRFYRTADLRVTGEQQTRQPGPGFGWLA